MPGLDDVFTALGDPTRREIVASLAGGEEVTASALASRFPMTRQAIAKHLSVLDRAGLVEQQRHGRETVYTLVADPLTDAGDWIATTGALWDRRLARLRARHSR